MKPVYQTRHGVHGDCAPACVASILELPIKIMPRIKATNTNWLRVWQKFLEPYGLSMIWYYARRHKRPPGWAIAAHRIQGIGHRYYHAVVYHNGRKVHDPYSEKLHVKSRKLLGIEYWMVFTLLEPKIKQSRLCQRHSIRCR